MNDRKREILNGLLKTFATKFNLHSEANEIIGLESGCIDFEKDINEALTALNALDRPLDAGWLRKYLSNYRGGLITMREALDKIQALSQKFDRPLLDEEKIADKLYQWVIENKYFITNNTLWSKSLAHALCEAHMKGELYG